MIVVHQVNFLVSQIDPALAVVYVFKVLLQAVEEFILCKKIISTNSQSFDGITTAKLEELLLPQQLVFQTIVWLVNNNMWT